MNPSVLRLGNIVINNNITTDIDNKAFTITGILTDMVMGHYKYLDHNNDTAINHSSCVVSIIEPMPLTIQWLFNFGYYTDDNTCHFDNDGVLEIRLEDGKYFGIIDSDHKVEVSSVHQFQNLYYAINLFEAKMKYK